MTDIAILSGINLYGGIVEEVADDPMFGKRIVIAFPNRFKASAISGPYTNGGKDGLWEIAVLDSSGDITYDTPVTGDVLGFLSMSEVDGILSQIAAL